MDPRFDARRSVRHETFDPRAEAGSWTNRSTDQPRLRRALIALTTVALLTVSVLTVDIVAPRVAAAVPGPVIPRTDSVVTADALPTVQVDGVVWSSVVVGNAVYAGGSFTYARPAGSAPGTNRTARANLLSFDLTTGALITGWSHPTNGVVQVVTRSPDGSRVYIGGDFTTVDGQTRQRLAAFDTATGKLVPGFAPNVGARVKAIAVGPNSIYIGGQFTTVSGQQRSRLAAVSPTNGAVQAWNPGADYTVNAMVVTPDNSRVIVGGAFQAVDAQPAYGLAAVNPTSGDLLTWAATQTVRNAGVNSAILGLSTDGTYIFGNGYVFGAGGNLEGAFSAEANSGKIRWIEDCHGDTYANFAVGSTVYTVSHAHYCANIGGYGESLPRATYMRHALAFTRDATGTVNPDPRGYPSWAGQPSPSLIQWYPELAVGSYTGQSQAAWTITGNNQYVVLGGEFPTVNGVGQQGLVRFAVKSKAPNARGPQLTGGKFIPTLHSFAAGTIRVAFEANYDQDDRSLNYRIVRDGNVGQPVYTTSAESSFWDRPTIGFTDIGLTPGTEYRYRLYVTDAAGNQVIGDTVRLVAPGSGSVGGYAQTAINQGASIYWRLGESSGTTAVDWAGVHSGVVGPGVTRGAAGAIAGDPNTASTFNGSAGGRVSSPTAMPAPTTYSASVWFKTTTSSGGKLIGFGDAQTSDSTLADRHIYLDNSGRLVFGVAPRGNVTIVSPGTYRNGQWHQVVSTLGPDGMRLYVDGAQVAARSDATSAEDIFGYWRVGGDAIASGWSNRPASGYFNGAIDEVSIYPKVLTSAQIAAQWAASRGAPANTPPVAAFTSSTSSTTATFNGSGSTDPDGTVSGFAWDFGDQATGAGAATSHVYAAAGTYPVTLTVTDDQGATNATTTPVTVSAPGTPSPVATDAFARTVASGWGAAEVVGSWTGNGAASVFSVNGSAGQVTMVSAGAGPSQVLSPVSAADLNGTVDFSVDKAPTGGGTQGVVLLRRTGTSDYRVKLRLTPTATSIQLSKVINNVETGLLTQTLAGLTYQQGDIIRLGFQITGATATISARAWKLGSARPATWQATTTDNQASLPGAGAIGLQAYLAGTATNAPVVGRFDNLAVLTGPAQ